MAIALLIASAAAAAASKISEGHAQSAAADADARMADQNKGIALDQGYAREAQQRRQSGQVMGKTAAAAAESGLVSNTGSMLDVQNQAARGAELDAQTVRYEGLMQGFGFERSAGLARARSKAATQGMPLAVASSVLGSASSYYGSQARTAAGNYLGG